MSAAVCTRMQPSQAVSSSSSSLVKTYLATNNNNSDSHPSKMANSPDPPTLQSYYASGSLPRPSSRRPVPPAPRNSSSLSRTNSMRNSWAINRSLYYPNPNGEQSPRSLIQADSISMNNQSSSNQTSASNVNRGNKYNTLTPAEAKKLSRYLSVRQPTRTASVLHRPRAPPLVITNLDDYVSGAPRVTTPNTANLANTNGLLAKGQIGDTFNGTRSASACGSYGSRNCYNLGPTSVYTTSNPNQDTKCTALNSPNDSVSDLSFRSSLDIVDSAYGSDRLQTMSVDLGNPSQHHGSLKLYNLPKQCDPDKVNKVSDDSYSSALSHQSESNKQSKSISRTSLSASTSKVFQNQLFNIKRFFRHMPIRRSLVNNNESKRLSQNKLEQSLSNENSLTNSISQVYLNRSQSPPVCPPPPKELKSMSYMESSVNYSNYDDFTQMRATKPSTLSDGHSNENYRQTGVDSIKPAIAQDRPDVWQAASLPISYERNLTTVFEEKLNLTQGCVKTDQLCNTSQNIYPRGTAKGLVKLPANFEDNESLNVTPISTDSSQSMNSITTADSVLDFHRQTATSFRFSYAQPSAFEHVSLNPTNQYSHMNFNNRVPNWNAARTNLVPPAITQGISKNNTGLPPRPSSEIKQETVGDSSSNHDSSSMNGPNNANQPTEMERNSLYDDSANFNSTNGYDHDADVTIQSDTSTLRGDTSSLAYRCGELERTVATLRNKLISKEKELTDLQLTQLSSDYLVDQLKSTICRLEKENAQYKAMIGRSNRVNL